MSIEPEAAHLLLVEDHADTAAVLARMLRRAGYRVTLASSVAEAVNSARTAQVEIDGTGRVRPVDLVVSDLGLPDGSGADLMRTLRAHHQLRGIALSGFGMDEDIRRALDAGFSRHITKPVDIPLLLGAIQELLQPVNKGEG
jgi:CheY-like chemotaxis protein